MIENEFDDSVVFQPVWLEIGRFLSDDDLSAMCHVIPVPWTSLYARIMAERESDETKSWIDHHVTRILQPMWNNNHNHNNNEEEEECTVPSLVTRNPSSSSLTVSFELDVGEDELWSCWYADFSTFDTQDVGRLEFSELAGIDLDCPMMGGSSTNTSTSTNSNTNTNTNTLGCSSYMSLDKKVMVICIPRDNTPPPTATTTTCNSSNSGRVSDCRCYTYFVFGERSRVKFLLHWFAQNTTSVVLTVP